MVQSVVETKRQRCGIVDFFVVLGQVNTVLNPVPDDSDTEAILIVEGSDTVKLTKLQVICGVNRVKVKFLCKFVYWKFYVGVSKSAFFLFLKMRSKH